MSLLASDIGFLLDQSIVLGLAAVPRDRLDFIGPTLLPAKIRAITRILPGDRTGLAIVKRGWHCAGKSRRYGTKNDSWSASGLLSPRTNPGEACRRDPGDITGNVPHRGRRILRPRPEVNRGQAL